LREDSLCTRSGKSSRRRKNKKSKKTDKDDGADSASSPRDSTSTFDPSRSPQSPTPADAKMQKLDELAAELNTKWLPLFCTKGTRRISQ
jgi:hypothetical protein